MLTGFIMIFAGDVKMVNVGHDHINDFCSTIMGIRLCYSGGLSQDSSCFASAFMPHYLQAKSYHINCKRGAYLKTHGMASNPSCMLTSQLTPASA